MKYWKYLYLLLATLGLNFNISAQDVDTSSTKALKKTTFSLIPSNYNVQYAGGIGLIATGPGWDYGNRKQFNTDFLLGYVPKYDTDKNKITLTLRQTYIPFKLHLTKHLVYEPMRIGIYISTTLGDQFWVSPPDQYPNNYYKFSTKMRFNIFLGQDVTYRIQNKKSYFESIKFYYDLHTNELYVMSRRSESYLKGKNHFGIALGAKLQIRRK